MLACVLHHSSSRFTAQVCTGVILETDTFQVTDQQLMLCRTFLPRCTKSHIPGQGCANTFLRCTPRLMGVGRCLTSPFQTSSKHGLATAQSQAFLKQFLQQYMCFDWTTSVFSQLYEARKWHQQYGWLSRSYENLLSN